LRAEFLDESSILIARRTAETMVHVGDGERERDLMTEKVEESQQGDRVAASRNGRQDAVTGSRCAVRTHRPPEDV